jgi:hypothetical protein
MHDRLAVSFYWLDLAIGYATPLLVWSLYRRARLSRPVWQLFWIGCALGLTWEVPVFVLSAHDTGVPLLGWVRPLPLPYPVFLLAHTLWDGGLLLVGLWLLRLLAPAPQLARFRWRELGVLLAWGQASALAVEVSSTASDGWAYLPRYWWNPTLFAVGGHPVTLLPLLVWLAAPVAFYAIALRLVRPTASAPG